MDDFRNMKDADILQTRNVPGKKTEETVPDSHSATAFAFAEMSIPDEVMRQTIVIIPALNEEKNIPVIVAGIRLQFPLVDVVVVNDGSSDNTEIEADKAGATVISHVNQMGYGVSLQTGYKYAVRKNKYSYIVQLDGDGQHNYLDIPGLLQPLIEDRADLIVGSRFLAKENSYRVPFVRKIGMAFFRALVYFFTRKVIKDVTSGFQAFNRKILKRYISDEFPSYYPDANVLILLVRNGFKVAEVPSAMFENKEGKSMHNRLGQQIYYVLTMILSILVVVLKNLGKKNAD